MNPIFDVSVISTQMSLIANFVVKDKQVQFLYHSPYDEVIINDLFKQVIAQGNGLK